MAIEKGSIAPAKVSVITQALPPHGPPYSADLRRTNRRHETVADETAGRY
jgi:hypothetical protein